MHAKSQSLLAAALLLAAGCSKNGEAAPNGKARPVPVTIASVEQKPMPREVRAVGTIEAYQTVSVLAQVGGEIRTVHFKEGDFVKKDEPLFTIDTRPYRVTLSEARARLVRDQALAKQAKTELDRMEKLVAEGVASQQELDKARSEKASAEATVQADRAAVSGAAIDVSYAAIRAPISGRTGSLLVHAGNVVKPMDKALVTIRTIRPIYVRFSVPELALARVRAHLKSGNVSVRVRPRGQDAWTAKGKLTFIENTIDPATGTIDMKAELDNADEALWPGQFVDAAVELEVEAKALVVPEPAVQSGQDGDHVFVVSADNHAELRHVKVDRQVGHEIVLASGVKAGDKVVTDGQIRLAPGSLVEAKAAPAPAEKPQEPAEKTRAPAPRGEGQ
ncbi:MAG: efflux RND transporter periplasmic adaptor subunit [Myxococcales bacterium]|nr:efflux RND transporter periplasmic adaptor subunit [Myxococcales bacterium]MCB9580886.1 efflux RND transporter periplasmic adaptor subunit [Polyangiaceae bacterium]